MVVFALLGAVIYLFSGWAAGNFAWRISPLLAMTIGAWFLGGAYIAFRSARLRAWSIVYPGLVFLGAFGLLELGVLIAHRDEVRLSSPVALGYVAALLIAALSAFVWLGNWIKSRDREVQTVVVPHPLVIRVLAAGFVVFAAYFSLRLLSGISKGGNIWPGELSLLTARSIGAFYLALGLAVLPMVWSKNLIPAVALLPAAAVIAILLIIPGVVYIELFDFQRAAGSLVFFGTYLFVFVAASIMVIKNRRASLHTGPDSQGAG
jgi:hypothetical protein